MGVGTYSGVGDRDLVQMVLVGLGTQMKDEEINIISPKMVLDATEIASGFLKAWQDYAGAMENVMDAAADFANAFQKVIENMTVLAVEVVEKAIEAFKRFEIYRRLKRHSVPGGFAWFAAKHWPRCWLPGLTAGPPG